MYTSELLLEIERCYRIPMKTTNVTDMLPVIIEQVTPLQDHFLRRRREKVWINTYQVIDYGANSRF